VRPLLQVENLEVVFPGPGQGTPVLDGLDLALHPREILGLVGESGCGKSVLARTLLRLEAPARIVAGSIRLAGVELTGRSRRQMRSIRGRWITLAIQNPDGAMDPLYPMARQFREVYAPAPGTFTWKKEKTAWQEHLFRRLREVGIGSPEERCRQYPHQWSRGMLQRAQLVMVFAARPRVVILDEITSALDSTVILQILGLIRRLRRQYGSAIILITHDLAVAGEICDRIAVMCRGRIVEQGPAPEVLARPKHPYTGMLVDGCRPGTDPAAGMA